MKTKSNEKGVTLIELLIVLILSGIVIGAIYRLFISQTRAYTVQDQVAETQQSVRNALQFLLDDFRNAGSADITQFPDHDNTGWTIDPINIIDNNDFELAQEVYVSTDPSNPYQVQKAIYRLTQTDALPDGTPLFSLNRQVALQATSTSAAIAQPSDLLLDRINLFSVRYGVDGNNDGIVDDLDGDPYKDPDYIPGDQVAGRMIIAVQIQIRVTPTTNNPNVTISPRSLFSTVALRNQINRSVNLGSKG